MSPAVHQHDSRMNVHDKKQAKREFVHMQRAVSEALRRLDPISLIEAGAPASEYDLELGTIMPRLREARTSEDLCRILHEEFVRWFGIELAGDKAGFYVAANEIWTQWLVSRARVLSGTDDVELIEPGSVSVLYSGERLEPLRILRLGTRFFVESTSEPGMWWMGSRDAGTDIHVWGQYGFYDEAFPQH